MRIPLSWLREFAQVPAGATAEDVMAELVKVGLEEEEVHRPTDALQGPIVVGQVLSMVKEPQTNGKTINWCQVRVVPEGQEQPLTGDGIDPSGVQGIICGAHNFVEGDKVVVTLPGAVLPGDFRISARKTYGHLSAGMIASVRELGIGEDHDGILVLSRIGLDPELGTDAMELLGLYDQAAEINVTPDRSYCFSIRGVAREYAHATGTAFTDPASKVQAPAVLSGGYGVKLNDDAPIYGKPGCDRFVARTVARRGRHPPHTAVDGLPPAARRHPLDLPAGGHLQLRHARTRASPLHFYDLDKLSGDIVVRRAVAGEKLTTLDGKDRARSTPEDLLITDESGAIGIAGVMGGASTEVSDATTNVLIEAAHFEEVSIARSRRRHKLPSEASKRFERGVDWHVAGIAAQRAVDLLVELAGGTADCRAGPTSGPPRRPSPSTCRPASPPHGSASTSPKSRSSPRSRTSALPWKRTTPAGRSPRRAGATTWKPRKTSPRKSPGWSATTRSRRRLPVAPPGPWPDAACSSSAAAWSRPWPMPASPRSWPTRSSSKAANDTFGVAEQGADRKAVKLANPISEEHGFLRTSVLPGLIEVAKRNHSRGFRDLALFEAGLVFLPGDTAGDVHRSRRSASSPTMRCWTRLYDGVPDQPLHVAAVLTGHDSPGRRGARAPCLGLGGRLDIARLAGDVLGVEIVVSQGQPPGIPPGPCGAAGAAFGRGRGLRRRTASQAAGGARHAGPLGGVRNQRRCPLRRRGRRDRGPAHLHLPGGDPGRGPGGAP